MTRSEHFAILGRYLGYPSCCIKQFCKDCCEDTKARFPHLLGTGYVPCLDCAQTIDETSFDAFLAREIAPRRVHPRPFPQEGDDVVELAYRHHEGTLPARESWQSRPALSAA